MIDADDANIDVTYGQLQGAFGPDEVGSHPRSQSPYGLADTSGNVWELTRAASGSGFVSRGGAYYLSKRTAHLGNRQEVPAELRHLHLGVRLCASLASP